MWNLSKKTLFLLMLITAILGGITSYYVDWVVFETGNGIFMEIQLPATLIILSILFLFKYVKKLKTEQKDGI